MTQASYIPEPPEEDEPQRDCPFCAGSGKVRDYKWGPSPFAASTTFSTQGIVDLSNYVYPICGT